MNETEPRILTITRIRDQARATRSFDLMPADSATNAHRILFIPGQVAILRADDDEPAYFAFAGAPEDAELEVLIKQRAGASKRLYDMHEGEHIQLLGVAGRGFDLERQKGKDLVFMFEGLPQSRA